ncbi:MAG: aldehyde dehydrogenase family protein [Sulfitobacter sp.]
MEDKTKHYINGAWVAQTPACPSIVLDPSTEQPVATISLGSQREVDSAVSAARAAQNDWANLPQEHRTDHVRRLLHIYTARAEEMAVAISTEMGAPIDLARDHQAPAGSWHIEGFLDAIKHHKAEEPLHDGSSETIVRDPVGVCGLITPWNWPMNQVTLKVIPAVLVGCTVVLKPSEIAPLSSMLFAEMIDEAGFPAGVFNLVNGDGIGVGSALSAHPQVDMMSFTGSTRAGMAVGKACVDSMKRCTLELGGKSPNLIFADADIATAVAAGVQLCMQNTGQSCNAPTRMLVERAVYDEAVNIASETAKAIKVGPSHVEGSHIGPLVSANQYDIVQKYIRIGEDEGARLVAGGLGHPEGMAQGYFARPTVFADVSNDMRIAQEEIFGPVLVMIPFDTEEDAIRIANETPFGLAAFLSTSDPARVQRVSRRLRAGMISANSADFEKGSPFGGFKMSGIGREGGVFGLEDFLEIKTIAI